MNWIDLGSPVPRQLVNTYAPFAWPEGKMIYQSLVRPSAADVTLSEILAGRRSRHPVNIIEMPAVATLFQLTCRIQATGYSRLGFPTTQRPMPSAGGIHPIHILVNNPGERNWWRYVADNHLLAEVPNATDVRAIREALSGTIGANNVTLILFVAEPGMTLAKYQDGCSLVWRDAGVLIGYLSIAAEALGLDFCPLGVTGDCWAAELAPEGQLCGVGMALLGVRPPGGRQ